MRTLNHVHSIPTAAYYEHTVTWLNLGPVTCGADTCWYATGNKAGEIKWNVSINHDDRGLIHHCVFGKTTNHAEGPDGYTLAVMPAVCAVELWPLGYARTFSAEMMQPQTTPPTNSTGRNER